MVEQELGADSIPASATDSSNNPPDVHYESEHNRKLFIGGLDHRTTEEMLKNYFEAWGKIVDVIVMKDPKTKRSRGFGFITYAEASMVDAAQAAHPHKIDGKFVEAKRAVPKNQITASEAKSVTVRKIFVAGIRDDVTEEDITNYFNEYGNVLKVSLVTDKETGRKRGFGFVEFDDYDAVDRVCSGRHTLKNKLLDIKKYLSKTEMAKLNNKNQQDNENFHSQNNSNWNARGANDVSGNDGWPGHYGAGGPPMNVGPNMSVPGYGPTPAWGPKNWISGPSGGMTMPSDNMGTGSMIGGLSAIGGMNNMGSTAMGNMLGVPSYGMGQNMCVDMSTGMGARDAQIGAVMYGSGMGPVNGNGANVAAISGPNQNMMNVPSMTNTAAGYWNYGSTMVAGNWSQPENFGTSYQQSYGGGPIHTGPVVNLPVRSAPYYTSTAVNGTGYGSQSNNSRRY